MISSFRGDHSFLSNFHLCPIELDGDTYPSVEHAFQAAKTTDPAARATIRAATAVDAKKLGRTVQRRPDWDAVKLDVMERLLRQKFSAEPLRTRLLATGDAELVEGNAWGDRIWGCTWRDGHLEGENHLGRALMRIRAALKESAVPHDRERLARPL